MSTAIQLFGSATLAEIDEVDLAIMQEAADESERNAYDYIATRIKMPSGGMPVLVTDSNEVIQMPMRMVVLVSQKARAFWPSRGTVSNKPPLCASLDAEKGFFDGVSDQIGDAQGFHALHPALKYISDPQLAAGPWPCDSCPLAQWGSAGEGERGQACKSLNKMLVLPEGWSKPAILTLPPTSLKGWNAYSSSASRKPGSAYFTRWTKLELAQEKSAAGITYSVARFSHDGDLSREQKSAVLDFRRQYAELVRSLEISAEDYYTGEVPPVAGEVVDGEMPPF